MKMRAAQYVIHVHYQTGLTSTHLVHMPECECPRRVGNWVQMRADHWVWEDEHMRFMCGPPGALSFSVFRKTMMGPLLTYESPSRMGRGAP